MKGLSYLLMLDGSKESRAAAALAWTLASKTGASVVAQHVVDSAAAWRFISFESAGFIGSGVFMEARERIISALHSIGDALVLSYECLAEGSSVKPETIIDEGDLVVETARRAKEHDLVICGRSAVGYSPLLERLAHECPCPILVMRRPLKPSSKLQIIATKQMPDSIRNSSLHLISKALDLPIEVQIDEDYLGSEVTELVQRWHAALDVQHVRRGTYNDALNGASEEDVLLLVPTSSLADNKLTGALRIVKRSFARRESRDYQFTEGPVIRDGDGMNALLVL